MKIINNQLDIKLGQFMQDELNIVLMKIPPEVWDTRKFNDVLLQCCI